MENTEQMSLLEIAVKLIEEKGPCKINDLIKEALALKGINVDNTDAAVQLYVDMTASSKFVYMGDDGWDLKANHKSQTVTAEDDLEDYDEESEDYDDAEIEAEGDMFEEETDDDVSDVTEEYKNLVIVDEDELEQE